MWVETLVMDWTHSNNNLSYLSMRYRYAFSLYGCSLLVTYPTERCISVVDFIAANQKVVMITSILEFFKQTKSRWSQIRSKRSFNLKVTQREAINDFIMDMIYAYVMIVRACGGHFVVDIVQHVVITVPTDRETRFKEIFNSFTSFGSTKDNRRSTTPLLALCCIKSPCSGS
ncbi:hypothetical protein PybrP1_006946 [[Pythium] brassicae (nom. inval.)]|nr:hypothetical protein PybrP1_006946 [[Pythium] brassicae (nom. inval.)]